MKEEFTRCEQMRKELEEQNTVLMQQKNDLIISMSSGEDALVDAEEKIEQLIKQKSDFESQLKELEDKLMDEEDAAADLGAQKKKSDAEISELKKDVEDLEAGLAKVRFFEIKDRIVFEFLRWRIIIDFSFNLSFIHIIWLIFNLHFRRCKRTYYPGLIKGD